MAITFPLSVATFADKLGMMSVKWAMRRHDELSGLGTGQTLGAELGPPLWLAEVELVPAYHDDADQIQALIESLDGPLNTFYLYSPSRRYPQYDPSGSILGAIVPTIHTVGSNMKSLRLQGLPNAYRLTVGDFLHFDYAGKRAFHRIIETVVTATGGVTPTFEVRPHLKTGVAVGQSVTLIKPAMKAFMIPDSFDPGDIQAQVTAGMSFLAMQRP